MTGEPSSSGDSSAPRFSYRPMRFTCIARTGDACSAIDHLLWLLENEDGRACRRPSPDRDRLRAALEAVALDLYITALDRPETFRSLSRERCHYGPGRSYPQVTALAVLIVVRFLVRAGLAAVPDDAMHRHSGPFLRATPLLVDLLEGVFAISHKDVEGEQGAPLVLLKTGTRKRRRLVSFKSTPATRAMHQRIAAANSLRAACRFSFAGKQPHPVDLGKGDVHRLFTDGRWDRGGRFHGGWWLMLRKRDRQRILANGEPTVELDYRACQPRICFHLEGHPLPPDVDPYAIPGFAPETYREAIKAAVAHLILFGAGPATLRPWECKALFPTNRDYAAFVEKVADACAPLAPWFGAGRAAELEFIESEIADAVMADMTRQGIVCLPIHDGFIVPRSAEAMLGHAMSRAYCDQLFDLTGIAAYPPIWGWSAQSVEDAVLASLPPLATGPHPSPSSRAPEVPDTCPM